MPKPIKTNDKALIDATGKTWKEWLALLNGMNAQDLSHKQIAAALESKFAVPGWWAQNITVRFEQEVGRRVPGQSCEGKYQVSVSSTFNGEAETIFNRWRQKYSGYLNFNGVDTTSPPTTSITPKWYYWRVKLADGSRLSVNFSKKATNKTLVAVSLENLSSVDEIEQWKTFWKEELKNFI